MAPPRPTTIVLAVLLPALLVAASLAGMERFRRNDEVRALGNAGQILDGRRVEDGAAAEIEATLEATTPQVLVLGNSLARADIDLRALASELRLPVEEVQRFAIPNSLAPHWFAILKNRVIERGHRPRLVVVVSDLQSLLAVEPRSEASYLNLTEQLSAQEPLIDKKIRRGSYTWDRIRENRGRLRDRAVRSLRNASVNLLRHGRLSTRELPGTNAALEEVFADGRTNLLLHESVIPVFNVQQRQSSAWNPEDLPTPNDSLVANLTRLATRNGVAIVYVRPPMSPELPEGGGDVVRPTTTRRTVELVERNQGVYLDLRSFPVTAAHFYNLDHMTAPGATRFTTYLVRAIQRRVPGWPGGGTEVDLLHPPAPLVPDEPAPRARATVVPEEPPALPGPLDDVHAGLDDEPAAWFDVPQLRGLSATRTSLVLPLAERCTPLRVDEDGVRLPWVRATCDEVRTLGNGRVCHDEEEVWFSASDGSSPLYNGRRYTLALARDRRCPGGPVWLYPGDRLSLEVPDAARPRLAEGVEALRLDAQVLRDGAPGSAGRLGVSLARDGLEVFAATLATAALRDGPPAWRLHDASGAGPRAGWVLTLENRSSAWVLVSSAVLAGRPIPEPTPSEPGH